MEAGRAARDTNKEGACERRAMDFGSVGFRFGNHALVRHRKDTLLLFRDKSSMLAWIAGIAAAAIVIVLWSLFFAPKAAHRLSLIPRIAVISAMALAAGLSLLKLGDKVSGWVLLTAVLLIQVFGQYMLNDRI